MDPQNHEDGRLVVEQKKLADNLETLQNTEGWKRLTDRQQRIIKQSLYIQARAERTTDPASKAAVHLFKDDNGLSSSRIDDQELLKWERDKGYYLFDPNTRKYQLSQNIIGNWNCHYALANLEQEKGLDFKPKKLPSSFFNTHYFKIDSVIDIEKMIDIHGYPCVVHSVIKTKNFTNRDSYHTFLALGRDGNQNIIAWEKHGYGYPYKITTLKNIFNEGRKDCLWGVRALRHQN